MTYGVAAIQLFTSDPTIPGSNVTGYTITDHNRKPLNIAYDRIELQNRMADGSLRRYVAANKKKISTSWEDVPAAGGPNFTADGNLGGAFLKSFYEQNIYNPIWVKLVYAEESWAWQNTNTASAIIGQGTNLTFNRTMGNTAIQSSYSINGASVSAFSGGSATVTLNTSVPHTLSSTPSSTYMYLTGIDQIYNGTWRISTASGSQISFTIGGNGNASADFNINSYSQSGSTTIFNIDNNDFVKVGASLVVMNSRGSYGTASSVNGTWLVTATSGLTLFTATNNTFSGSSLGYAGTGVIMSSAGSGKNITQLNPGLVAPAVGSDIIKCFITNFTYDVNYRFVMTDYVNISLEFTEI